MRKTLLATTALACAGALAAGPASAADMLSVGIGGYMEQWVGMADVDGATNEGAIEVKSDTELYFKGSLAADNGLTFSIDVQLEGTNNAGSYIDESSLKVTGDFGDLRLGSEDAASNLMHYGATDVGVGFTAGDFPWWFGFGAINTYGQGSAGFADIPRIVYFTPRMEGVQLGLSYTPDTTLTQAEQNTKPSDNNDMDSTSIGLNYKGAIGESSVSFSLGHHVQATDMDDDATYTNLGLKVGMGAFGFNVAWAGAEDGDDADTSSDSDTVTLGASYTQDALSVSMAYGMVDRGGDGVETTSAILSARYVLAPGVAFRTSLFTSEEGDMEGVGLAGGIGINF